MKNVCIIPAYNEEKTIGKVIDKVKKYKKQCSIKKIIVIDDGSRDRTSEAAKSHGAKVVRHIINRGIGAAQQTGYEIAISEGFDYLIQLDADGQHDPRYIPKLLQETERGYDMVIASRFVTPDTNNIPLVRKIGIFFFSKSVSFFSGQKITDVTSGYRVYRTKKLGEMSKLNDSHWAVEQFLEAKKNSFKTREIPVRMSVRKSGKSQFSSVKTLFMYPMRMADVFLRLGIRRLLD